MTQQQYNQFNELVMAHLDKVGASYFKDDVYSNINHVLRLETSVGGFRVHLPKKGCVLYTVFCRFENPELAWPKFPSSNQYTGKYNHFVGCVDPEEAAHVINRHIDFIIEKSQR